MADVRDVVTDALQEIGVIAAGETATAEDALSGLRALNRLVDQWAAERLMIYTITRTTHAITASQQNYTVGSTGEFAVVWPVYIDHFAYQDSTPDPDAETPLNQFTEAMWAGIIQKSLTSSLPSAFYYNPTYPTGTISLWPIPTSTTLTGVLYAPQQVAEFTSLSTAISLPPGYRRMLVKNLALEMAPGYERPARPELIMAARESKGVVKRANGRLRDLGFDPGLLGGSGGAYNIETDR